MVGTLWAAVSPSVDSHVFRLHYRWTSAFCFITCALVTALYFIGDPIMCINNSGSFDTKTFNTWCWTSSTFTIKSSLDDTHSPAHPGVDRHTADERIYHAYYRWVPIVLFIQGCLFYLPHLLWKTIENKTVDSLLQGLNINSIGDHVDAKKDNIIKYLKVSAGQNWRYSVVYLTCEALNFANVIGQMFMLDKFFGGMFMELGIKLINFDLNADDEERIDPLMATFPRLTKCRFTMFGGSGELRTYEALCILSQNILNEKIFIFMWFWFVILATITAAYLVWIVVLMASPEVRVQWMLRLGGDISTVPGVEDSIRRLHLGDFFLLNILKRNVDVLVFRDIVTRLGLGAGATPLFCVNN